MTAKTLVIGLDGADCMLVSRWAKEGVLPTFAKLAADGARAELANPMGTLPGVLWNEIIMSQSANRVPFYYYPRQLRTGEAVARRIKADDVDPQAFFWRQLVRQGRRVAVLDVPYMVLDPQINGIQVTEWGMHDPEFGYASVPATLAGEIVEKYGPHPVSQRHNGRCDHYPKTEAGYLSLLDDLLEGLARRTKIYTDLIQREEWDLFFGAYSEAHCAGHHFFHFHDSSHVLHSPDAPSKLRDAMKSVYSAIDASIAAILEKAGPDVRVFVFCPQGMTQFTGGQQMMPEILARLGLASDKGAARDSLLRKLNVFVKQHAPKSLTPLLRSVAQTGPARALQAQAGCLLDPFTSEGTKAAAVANNRIAAIRLNLKGRDPFGSVAPGEEANALIEYIKQALMELRLPGTDKTVVKHCMTTSELYGPEVHPDLPDLLVEFRTDIGPIESCWSERLGTITVEFGNMLNGRTGDHTTDGMLWAAGPGIPSGVELPRVSTMDIGPTVLAQFGVDIPNIMDGRPIAQLFTARSNAAE